MSSKSRKHRAYLRAVKRFGKGMADGMYFIWPMHVVLPISMLTTFQDAVEKEASKYNWKIQSNEK